MTSRMILILLWSIALVSALDRYQNDSKLYVHLIAHTHDDVGWLKSVEEYFYGYSYNITNLGPSKSPILGVQYIIEEIIGELMLDSEKRFSWVEIGYFYRYWINQEDSIRENVRNLVKEGRLEFINGGWSMHDEAVTYYEDMIDNMALGQKFLKDNFNVCPTLGWQIDPFGHSSTNAALFSKMGLDTLWFTRIDHAEKDKRKQEKNLEFIWQPRTSQSDENQILTIVQPNHYDFPDEFCFDYNCYNRQPPVVDDESLPNYNADQVAKSFVDFVQNKMKPNYNHNHVAFMMGGDFAYEISSMPFTNFGKIKKYINARPDQFNIEVLYSSPSEYTNAIYSKGLNLTTNYADFFPYADKPEAYWTGYYSSRNNLKRLVRKAGKDLQNVRRLFTYSLWRGINFEQGELVSIWDTFHLMERKQAELQHHDAITGTSQQHVADEYTTVLTFARDKLHLNVTNLLLQKDFQKLIGTDFNVEFEICEIDMVNSTSCDTDALLSGLSLIAAVFNPIEAKSRIVSLSVPNANLKVTSLSGRDINAEVVCIDYLEIGCTLYFEDDFAGQSTQYYIIESDTGSLRLHSSALFQNNSVTEMIQIADGQFLQINNSLVDYKSIAYGVETDWSLSYNYYNPRTDEEESSGVYVFRPQKTSHHILSAYSEPTHSNVFIGGIVVQIVIIWEDKIVSKITIFDDLSNIKIDTLITDDGYGQAQEIVMVIKTDIQNGNTFYTDSNGMDMQKRKLNYRENWNWTSDEPISGNYYPITSSIYIEDSVTQKRATLLVDRAVGGSSLEEGQLEIMLDRRHLLDDKRGIGEPLNEPHMLDWHSTNLLITTLNSNKGHYYRSLQYDLDQPILVFAATIAGASNLWSSSDSSTSTGLLDLPANVKILPWPISESVFIVRFHNMDDDKNVAIDLTKYFNTQYGSPKLTETTITGNQDLESMLNGKKDWTYSRPSWQTILKADYLESQQINLRGQEIRTFRIDFETDQLFEGNFIKVGKKTPKNDKRKKDQQSLRG